MRLYIDIETIPDQRDGAFERYIEKVQAPGQYKKQESIDKWLLENAERVALEEFKKTALNGLYGEIVSIAFAVEDRDIQVITRGWNENDSERALLDMFWFMLRQEVTAELGESEAAKAKAAYARVCWVGHNVLDFDLRILKQRSFVNQIRPDFHIHADARHGGDQAFDTMKEWAGWRGYVKLDDLVEVLVGDIFPEWADRAVPIDGSQVWDVYRDGEFGLLSIYNKLDVWKVREVYRRMTYAS